MLYVFEDIDKQTDDFLERCIPYLSAQRLEKVLSYRFPMDRRLSAVAYLLLRLALKENHGIEEPAIFSYGRNGKPFLRGSPQIHFNLSHCSSAVACAISHEEIGVDVQEIAPVSEDLAARVLTANEFARFKAAANPSLRFCGYWVVKESLLKKTGEGVGVDLTALSSDSIGDKTLFGKDEVYRGCLAGDFVRLRYVDAGELIPCALY